MPNDGDGGGALPGVNVLDEVHIERERHHTFSDGGAGNAEGNVGKRLQRAAMCEAILVRMLRIVDNKTQSGLSVSYGVNRDPTVRNKLIILIYVSKNFKAGLRIQRKVSFRFLLKCFERIVAYSQGRKQRGAVFVRLV